MLMNGRNKNTYNNNTKDTYLSDLLFRQNNTVFLLNNKDDIRSNDTLLSLIKNIENNNITNKKVFTPTKCKD